MWASPLMKDVSIFGKQSSWDFVGDCLASLEKDITDARSESSDLSESNGEAEELFQQYQIATWNAKAFGAHQLDLYPF